MVGDLDPRLLHDVGGGDLDEVREAEGVAPLKGILPPLKGGDDVGGVDGDVVVVVVNLEADVAHLMSLSLLGGFGLSISHTLLILDSGVWDTYSSSSHTSSGAS